MSTGLVICSKCRRELHQSGDRAVNNGWVHCDDSTPRCDGATSDYPRKASATDVRGRACCADGPLPVEGQP